jgi:TolB-like protein
LYELNTGLDRKSFPALPPDPDGAIDHRRFLGLNEVVLQASAPHASRRPTAYALLDDLIPLQTGRCMLGKRVVRWLSPMLFRFSLAAAGLGLAATGAWLWPKISTSTRSLPAINPINHRYIAVLPFDNHTPQSDFSLFADGVHEDLILGLAKIHDLKVISRASVIGYRQSKKLPKDIAEELGVGSILKGTVKREGDQVRVTVELIDPATGYVRWGEKYQRKLTDASAIQSALSQQIAGKLHATLTDNERQLVDHRLTANADAYDLFLQARELFRQLGSYGGRQYGRVIEICEAAIKADSEFAEAHVQLSLAHSYLYRFSDADPTQARLDMATAAANEAARIRPNLPEAKLARGVVHYLAGRGWPSALTEFRAAEKDLPNDEQLQWWTGNVLRRLGRWDAAIKYFKSSSRLNPKPRAPLASLTAIQTMRYLRRFTEARELADAQVKRFPEYRPLAAEFERCQFEVNGNRAAFFAKMDALPSGDITDESAVIQRKYETAYRRGAWEIADRILSEPKLTGIGENPSYVDTPVALHRALVAWLANRNGDIDRYAEQALRDYDRGAWNPRQVPWVMIGRARAYALLGRGDDALNVANLGWKAVENIDAQDEAIMRTKLAEIRIILGRTDEALDFLQQMMEQPCDSGPHALRADPLWQRLGSDPRFEEILRSAKPLYFSPGDER